MKNAFSFFTPRADDVLQRLANKIAAYLSVGLGLGGVDHVADTAAHNGDWWCLHALGGDVVISSITYASGTAGGSAAGATISKSDRIYGHIISFTLTSGRVEAYRSLKA